MASWGEIERMAPELAADARKLLEAHVHKTMATVRADGSPRISGIEAKFIAEADGEEELWFGSMPGSRKSADLARDSRFSLHSGSDDPPDWRGDAKLSGIAEEIVDRDRKLAIFKAMGAEEVDEASALYRVDVRELAVTRLTEAKDELAVAWWNEAGGERRLTRK
jgi:general stress protein 26